MNSVPALIVTLLCGVFAFSVMRRYLRHRRLSHLFWMISLAASALASLAYCLAVWMSPHNAGWFRTYYILGAMWMPAIMGLGSLALILNRRWVYGFAFVVGILGIVGSEMLLQQSVSAPTLASLDGGAGTGIIHQGAWLVPLITLNSLGAVAVILVALWSAWKFIRNRQLSRFFYGNVWLAVGVLIISAAGSSARFGWAAAFWVVMLVGWIVTFVGYAWLTPRLAQIPVK